MAMIHPLAAPLQSLLFLVATLLLSPLPSLALLRPPRQDDGSCHALKASSLSPSSLSKQPSRFSPLFQRACGEQRERWFNQTLDHFSPTDRRTFPQRFHESLSFFSDPTGPVFVFICGEAACGGISDDFRLVLASKFNAAIVALEHRHYGKSTPFSSLSLSSLHYLSTQQAIADLASFQAYYQAELVSRFALPPSSSNPFLLIGGSYSGALSAWTRLKFPHLFAAALASSAVVNAVEDFHQFEEQVVVSAGPGCAELLRQVTAEVERELAADAAAIKERFGAAEVLNNGDFMFLVADAAVFAFQYGHPDDLCLPLAAAQEAGGSVLDAYIDYTRNFFFARFGGRPGDYDRGVVKVTEAGDVEAAARAWWYQCCTQVAYFQTPAVSVPPIRSSLLNITYWHDFCTDVFGPGVVPDTEALNVYYGSTAIAGTKIFFTNGSQDPWQKASKKKSTAEEPSELITCHNCGHCSDIRGCPQWVDAPPHGDPGRCENPDSVRTVRHKLIASLKDWLETGVTPQVRLGKSIM